MTNKFNSVTYTVASSLVSPLAVTSVVGQSRSFLLTMCTFALESTINSFVSGFNTEAASEREKNVALSFA